MCTPIEGENLVHVLNDLEIETEKYLAKGNKPFPGVNDDFHAIQDYVKEQQLKSKDKEFGDNINAVGQILKTLLYSMKDLTSGEPLRVMNGSLAIVSNIVEVVGGPFGAIIASFCSVMGAIISLSTPEQPDMATKFVDLVHSELNIFNQKRQNMQLEGLRMRVANMTERLSSLKKEATLHLLNEDIFLISFPQFIGEVSYNIRRGLTKDSKQSDRDDCVYSMVAYCNAQTSFFLLLGNLISRFTKIGADPSDYQGLYRSQVQHAIETLGFLSEENSLTFLGTLDEGKRFMILQLRGNVNAYNSVEVFREFLGLTKMKDLKYLQDERINLSGPRFRTEDYPNKHFWSLRHWFQFINETDFEVKIIMPGVGSLVSNLKFVKIVKPRNSYERKASISTQYFSAGGFFIIYLDGQIATNDDSFPNNGNFKVYEFSLSCPLMGLNKIKFIEKSDNILEVNGKDCWNAMDSGELPQPHYWSFRNKHYVVGAEYSYVPGFFYALTYQFILEDYDLNNLDSV